MGLPMNPLIQCRGATICRLLINSTLIFFAAQKPVLSLDLFATPTRTTVAGGFVAFFASCTLSSGTEPRQRR